MKNKLIPIIMTLLTLSLLITAQQPNTENTETNKLNNLNTFMGIKWDTKATDFKKNFKYKDKLKIKDSFFLLDFKLGHIIVSGIEFNFKGKHNPKLKFKKNNFKALYFQKALIHYNPNSFEFLYETFIHKYGPPQKYEEYEIQIIEGPKYQQKEAVWGNKKINRMIILHKFNPTLEEGLAYFLPYDEEALKNRRQRIRETAKIL